MKICVFVQSTCGGAERMSILISKMLNKKHDITIHAFGKENLMQSFIGNEKLVFHQAPSAIDKFIGKARAIIKEEKPDVIFCSLMPLNWRLALAAIGTKSKIVFRSDNYIDTQSFSSKVRLFIAYKMADAVIAQTEEMRQGIIRQLHISPKKIFTIHNPIDTEYIDSKIAGNSPFTGDYTNYVAVGRYAHEKGFDILIKAFNEVRKSIPNAKLHILGDYHYDLNLFEQLKGLVDEFGIKEHVNFAGYTSNPYIYMKHADCFVLSSRNEALPNVLIEAQYCGTPAAAIKCRPIIERIIDEGNTGFLAMQEDYKGLADAMMKCKGLGRIKTTYKSGGEEDINSIFEAV